MTQNVNPFLTGIDEYLKLEPEHPELAVRIGCTVFLTLYDSASISQWCQLQSSSHQ